MTEDAGKYVDVECEPIIEHGGSPPTVTVLIQHERNGRWTLRCCPPPEVTMPTVNATAETLSEALTSLAERVEEWEEQQDQEDDYDDEGVWDDED